VGIVKFLFDYFEGVYMLSFTNYLFDMVLICWLLFVGILLFSW